MAAAKFLDAIARFPGCSGEDSDAINAYTQVSLDNLAELLGTAGGKSIQPETWISLPRNRRPKEWDNIDQPVVKLLCNLYGHPLAGLIWEKHCHRAILGAGFEQNPGWECLLVHNKKQLYLSVYVDDSRMSGNTDAPSF